MLLFMPSMVLEYMYLLMKEHWHQPESPMHSSKWKSLQEEISDFAVMVKNIYSNIHECLNELFPLYCTKYWNISI